MTRPPLPERAYLRSDTLVACVAGQTKRHQYQTLSSRRRLPRGRRTPRCEATSPPFVRVKAQARGFRVSPSPASPQVFLMRTTQLRRNASPRPSYMMATDEQRLRWTIRRHRLELERKKSTPVSAENLHPPSFEKISSTHLLFVPLHPMMDAVTLEPLQATSMHCHYSQRWLPVLRFIQSINPQPASTWLQLSPD